MNFTFDKYHKINGLYKRYTPDNTKDKSLHGQFIMGKFAQVEFECLFNAPWIWTEKIDGTNIRIGWDGEKVYIGGRTDAAQLHVDLIKRLQELFPAEKMIETFGVEPQQTILFGEGYGAGIQKGGGDYVENHTTKDFILFDVNRGGYWLERENVNDIGSKLGVFRVPQWGTTATIAEAIDFVKTKPVSWLSQSVGKNKVMEGLVGTPLGGILDRRGNRIITKVKVVDFI